MLELAPAVVTPPEDCDVDVSEEPLGMFAIDERDAKVALPISPALQIAVTLCAIPMVPYRVHCPCGESYIHAPRSAATKLVAQLKIERICWLIGKRNTVANDVTFNQIDIASVGAGGDVLIGDAGLLHTMVLLAEEIPTALTGVVAKM